MKKIFAITLAAMMCLCTVSFAESATPAATEAAIYQTTDLGQVEVTYEQSPLTFESGAGIILPATWTATDLTDEMTTAGVIYAAWQTMRADDELCVADDPLRAPDA